MKDELFNELFKTPTQKRLLLEEKLILAVKEELYGLYQEKGINRADVSLRTGISLNRINDILDGDDDITLREVASLAWAAESQLSEIEFQPIPQDDAASSPELFSDA
jgi:hypothetical protein